MAVVKREKNCGNCIHCFMGGNVRRFRCTAIPRDPSEWWDGFPQDHWCASNWEEKKEVESPKEVKPPIKVTQEK